MDEGQWKFYWWKLADAVLRCLCPLFCKIYPANAGKWNYYHMLLLRKMNRCMVAIIQAW